MVFSSAAGDLAVGIFTFWAQLTHEQQEAAHTLGYRQEIWDEEVLVDAEAAGFPDGA